MEAHATSLYALSPSPSTTPHCTAGDYLDVLASYADMYDTVHQTSAMLIGAVLAECGRVLAAASSMSSAAAGMQWKYVLVWRSGCGTDSAREQQLERRWKADREWRKAETESSKATERKSISGSGGTADESKSDKKKQKSKPKP